MKGGFAPLCLAAFLSACHTTPPAETPVFDAFERTIPELQAAMARGDTTSVRLTQQYLARIGVFDDQGPRLNAMLYVNPRALEDANVLDRERAAGKVRGPLHGIPIVLKDNYGTHDMPTTAGVLALAGFVPQEDALLVRRLREAGAVIIGKTNLHELARGIFTVSSLGGYTRNPYDPDRNPGGSSGGTAAAVAANFAAAGFGSDTCGSIRIPAAYNNLFGLRATQGTTLLDGIVPLAHTQDVAGPLARSMVDLATLLDVTVDAPGSFIDALQADALQGARLGVLSAYLHADEPRAAVTRVVRAALAAMEKGGAEIVEIDVDGLDKLSRRTSVIDMEFQGDIDGYLQRTGAPVQSLAAILESGDYRAELERAYRRSIEAAHDVDEYRARLARRDELAALLIAALDDNDLDALVYPTIVVEPRPIGEGQSGSLCRIAAHSGLPAISLPAGFTAAGLPVGVELLARPLEDSRLVALGYAWEQLAQPRRPPATTPSMLHAAPPGYDLLIRGGTIVDGTGSPAFAADVGIVGDRIVKIGDLDGARAARVIDASGLTVAPGFIDLHNHGDRNVRDNPDVSNYLYQGVTTILTGNCGKSPVDVGDFFASVEATGIGPNLGLLIGHNNVRDAVMGNDNRAPTDDELGRMQDLVREAMDAGVFGLSTGLIYLPGTYSETGEVVALARVVAEEGGIYASHIRNEFDRVAEAIEEAIAVGREAGLPVHISHFKVADNRMWGQSTMTLGLVEAARDEGLDVTIDQYPYTAGSTGLANVIPAWARAGSQEDFQARLDDPETRARIRAETVEILNGARAAGDLSRITIASFPSHPEYAGRTLAEVTQMHGLEPTVENGADVAMEILYDGEGSAIYHMMVEEDVRRIMQAPFTHIASDGSAVAFGENVPHLRNYGTFPRVLRRYVREEGLLTLEEAIHKMTAMPAERIGLSSRGRLAEGMVADIGVFDFETVSDYDDWAHPHRYATGFTHVIVGGNLVIDDGERTSALPGKVLRRTAHD